MSHKQIQHTRGTEADIRKYVILDGELIICSDDGSIFIGDGVTAGGGWRVWPLPAGDPPNGYQIARPSPGQTIFTRRYQRRLQLVSNDPSGYLATLTVRLPPFPRDGDLFTLATTQTIGVLHLTCVEAGKIVMGNDEMLAMHGTMGWLHVGSDNTWYRHLV
jgi:hypothetical protein